MRLLILHLIFVISILCSCNSESILNQAQEFDDPELPEYSFKVYNNKEYNDSLGYLTTNEEKDNSKIREISDIEIISLLKRLQEEIKSEGIYRNETPLYMILISNELSKFESKQYYITKFKNENIFCVYDKYDI